MKAARAARTRHINYMADQSGTPCRYDLRWVAVQLAKTAALNERVRLAVAAVAETQVKGEVAA